MMKRAWATRAVITILIMLSTFAHGDEPELISVDRCVLGAYGSRRIKALSRNLPAKIKTIEVEIKGPKKTMRRDAIIERRSPTKTEINGKVVECEELVLLMPQSGPGIACLCLEKKKVPETYMILIAGDDKRGIGPALCCLIDFNMDGNVTGQDFDFDGDGVPEPKIVELLNTMLKHEWYTRDLDGDSIPDELDRNATKVDKKMPANADYRTMPPQDSAGWTPMHYAAFLGDAKSIKSIKEMHKDLMTADSAGWTPLDRAAYEGHTEAARVLLELGADPARKGVGDRTPFTNAGLGGGKEMMKVLIPAALKPSLNPKTSPRSDVIVTQAPRTWTSTAGSELTAELIDIESGIVTLKKKDGKELKVPLRQLAPPDQAYIKKTFPNKH